MPDVPKTSLKWVVRHPLPQFFIAPHHTGQTWGAVANNTLKHFYFKDVALTCSFLPQPYNLLCSLTTASLTSCSSVFFIHSFIHSPFLELLPFLIGLFSYLYFIFTSFFDIFSYSESSPLSINLTTNMHDIHKDNTLTLLNYHFI